MEFIYPSELFNNKLIDENYKEEYELIQKKFKTHLIDIDNIEDVKKIIVNDNVIYRGWMLSEEKYQLLENKILLEDRTSALKISSMEYLSSHHLPNWYEDLKDFTPKSIITSKNNIKDDFIKTGWQSAFVKDYVKSIKTGSGSIVYSGSDIDRVISDILKYKGFIEGGLILRQTHKFNPESEVRYFVLDNQLYVDEKYREDEKKKELALNIMNKIKNRFFYSIDIVEDENNKNWVVEIGDGQVSDYVGWEVKNFASIFSNLEIKNIKAFKF